MAAADLLTAALDSMPFVITSVSPDGVILFVNRIAADNLSAPREQLIGTSLYDYFPDRVQATRERIRQTVARREVQYFQAEVVLPDGRRKFFESEYCPAFDDGGEVIAVQIVARDVTVQRRANLWGVVTDDLSMTAERVKAIFEHAPIAISVCDPDMTIRYANHVIVDVDQVIGRSARDWIDKASWPELERAFQRVLERGEVAECELRGMSGNYWFVRFAPLVSEGSVTQVLGCTLDITAQKQLQAELAHKRKIESLGTMARGIAHDFNNLLTTTMGYTGLVRRWLGDRNPEVATFLDEIDVASRRAAELCDQMLVYAGRDLPDDEPGELNPAIVGIAPLTRAAVNARIRLAYDLGEALPPVSCGRSQLGQVVLNLINNAADAIGDRQGEIRVSTSLVELAEPITGDYVPARPAPGRYVRLEVADSGRGLDADAHKRIFDPFYSTKDTGHGLGLSVVLGILSSHGAVIAVDSAAGRGTTMTVLFPARDCPAGSWPDESTGHALHTGRGTVLLVDDEEAVRAVASIILAEAGYDVIEAADGDAALELLARHRDAIRAVILDVTMPGRDGHSTLCALRAEHPALPVLLSSGKPLELDADPNTRFLPKPYTPAALSRALSDALGD